MPNRSCRVAVKALAGFALLFLGLSGQALAKNVAFVVGNNLYDNLDQRMQLQKAVPDAGAVSAKLEAIGFKVFTTTNATKRAFLKRWQAFLDAVEPGDVTAFYFAGHGFEINGANYLLLRDVAQSADGEEAIRGSSLRVGELLDRLKEQQPQITLFIIDACRNNPFAGATRSVGGSRGLRREDPPRGTLLMMSAGAGQEALDSLSFGDPNPNSVYTRTLVPLLGQPGLEITDLAKRVRGEVEKLAATVQHVQRPAFYHELSGDFYLVPPPADFVVGRPDAARFSEAAEAWAAVRSSPSQAVLEAYARDFPNTVYAALARARLDMLRKKTEIAALPAASDAAPVQAAPQDRNAEAASVWNAIQGSSDRAVLDTFAQVYQGTESAAKARGRLAALPDGTPVEGPQADPPAVMSPAPPTAAPFRDCPTCPELVVLPAGSFTMGSPADEEGRAGEEGPQHAVRIAKAVAVGRFAVSHDEWSACIADGGCDGYRPPDPWGRAKRFPVVNVSFADARAYVSWLSRTTGKPYRLPSEAEREYAARAGSATPFWWGAAITPRQANYDASVAFAMGPAGEGRGKTLPVDFFAANPWGLHQVHGNVSEWVEDCFHPSYDGAPQDGRARTSEGCTRRVLRGGSWSDRPQAVRAASRAAMEPGYRGGTVGFRVARDF